MLVGAKWLVSGDAEIGRDQPGRAATKPPHISDSSEEVNYGAEPYGEGRGSAEQCSSPKNPEIFNFICRRPHNSGLTFIKRAVGLLEK